MSLHRLLFDTANPAESANVGAFVRAGSDGDLISSTLVSGKEGLDAYIINASLAVTASDFDIRDLTHVSDSVKIGDGTDFLAIAADGSIAVTDNGSSLTVDAVNLDIRDLVAATDSVSSWTKDGSGTSITSTLVSGKQALDVNIANSIDVDDDLANTALSQSSETVTTTSGALFTSPLANRKHVYIYNHGNQRVYIGASGVSTANGFPIFAGSLLQARIGDAVAIHAVAQAGSQDVRTLQLS